MDPLHLDAKSCCYVSIGLQPSKVYDFHLPWTSFVTSLPRFWPEKSMSQVLGIFSNAVSTTVSFSSPSLILPLFIASINVFIASLALGRKSVTINPRICRMKIKTVSSVRPFSSLTLEFEDFDPLPSQLVHFSS